MGVQAAAPEFLATEGYKFLSYSTMGTTKHQITDPIAQTMGTWEVHTHLYNLLSLKSANITDDIEDRVIALPFSHCLLLHLQSDKLELACTDTISSDSYES